MESFYFRCCGWNFFYFNVRKQILVVFLLFQTPLKKKKLSGEGDNMALWIYLEKSVEEKFNSIEVKNAVSTDLFYDQNNIVYIHIDEKSKSLMLNKETSTYKLNF